MCMKNPPQLISATFSSFAQKGLVISVGWNPYSKKFWMFVSVNYKIQCLKWQKNKARLKKILTVCFAMVTDRELWVTLLYIHCDVSVLYSVYVLQNSNTASRGMKYLWNPVLYAPNSSHLHALNTYSTTPAVAANEQWPWLSVRIAFQLELGPGSSWDRKKRGTGCVSNHKDIKGEWWENVISELLCQLSWLVLAGVRWSEALSTMCTTLACNGKQSLLSN